jgi:hypothetical protein
MGYFDNAIMSGIGDAASGFAVTGGNPYGAAIGGAIGLGTGLLNGMNKPKQPPLNDPNQLAFLEDIQRKRRALATGQDYAYTLANKQNQQQLAQTQQNVLRSGSDMASVQQGLNISQQNSGNQSNKSMSEILQQGGMFTQMAGQQIDAISKRKFDLQFQDYLQKLREKSEATQGMTQNIMGAAGMYLGNKQNQDFLSTLSRNNGTNNAYMSQMPQRQSQPLANPNDNYNPPSLYRQVGLSDYYSTPNNYFGNQQVGSLYANNQ